MNKIDTQNISLTLSPASNLDVTSSTKEELTSWLIVLIPNFESDLSAVTHRVWELANSGSKRVLLISLYQNLTEELTLRRQLAGMAAMLNNAGIYTETEIASGNDWAKIVRSRSHVGDMVACFANHRVGLLNLSLSNILQTQLDLPIYILSSSYLRKETRLNWRAQLLAWAGFIVVPLGFFLLQIRIDKLTSGWVQLTLLIASVALELWMIWVWNSLFG